MLLFSKITYEDEIKQKPIFFSSIHTNEPSETTGKILSFKLGSTKTPFIVIKKC